MKIYRLSDDRVIEVKKRHKDS